MVPITLTWLSETHRCLHIRTDRGGVCICLLVAIPGWSLVISCMYLLVAILFRNSVIPFVQEPRNALASNLTVVPMMWNVLDRMPRVFDASAG